MSSLDTTLVAGRYDAYKRATERFLKWLRSAVPHVKIPPVESMVDAAREFAARGELAPASIIKDLEKCIAVRTAVHEMYTAHTNPESESDRTHGYFIDRLRCVRLLLRTSEATPQPETEPIETDAPDANAFAALAPLAIDRAASSIDDAGADADDDATATTSPVVEPRAVDIMGESESFAAMCFLLDVEAAQKEVVAAWAAFRDGHSTILEPTALTNALVSHVDALATRLQLEHPALRTVEDAIAAASLRVEETAPGDDFLSGSSGLLVTSRLARRLAAGGALREPSNYTPPVPDGEPWDEASRPASSTRDLMNYAAGAIPTLVWAANMEDRPGFNVDGVVRDRLLEPFLSSLGIDECMPLWSLLQKQMARTGRNHAMLAPGLVFAFHAMLLSVVVVNGDGRCAALGAELRVYIDSMFHGIKETVNAIDPTGTMALAPGVIRDYAYCVAMWLVNVHERASLSENIFSLGLGSDQTPGLIALCERHRDNALVLNPWVAGQQTLFLALGVGISCSVRLAEELDQTRIILHSYNALLKAELMGSSETAEALLNVFSRGNAAKALWMGGRRAEAFLAKSLMYSVMGMSATNMDRQRRCGDLIPFRSADISPVFRCVVKRDYGAGAPEIDAILEATRDAFATDAALKHNLLHACGAFEKCADELVDVLGAREDVGPLTGYDSWMEYVGERDSSLMVRLFAACDFLLNPDAVYSRASADWRADFAGDPYFMAAIARGKTGRDLGTVPADDRAQLEAAGRLVAACCAAIPVDPVTRLRGGELLGARAPRPEETADEAPPVAATLTPSEYAAAEAAARDSFAVELPSPAPGRARKGKKKRGKKKR